MNWEEDSDVIKCLHLLTHKEMNKDLQCTQLSWNKTGSTLAVAYGRMDHQDWCTHKVNMQMSVYLFIGPAFCHSYQYLNVSGIKGMVK